MAERDAGSPVKSWTISENRTKTKDGFDKIVGRIEYILEKFSLLPIKSSVRKDGVKLHRATEFVYRHHGCTKPLSAKQIQGVYNSVSGEEQKATSIQSLEVILNTYHFLRQSEEQLLSIEHSSNKENVEIGRVEQLSFEQVLAKYAKERLPHKLAGTKWDVYFIKLSRLPGSDTGVDEGREFEESKRDFSMMACWLHLKRNKKAVFVGENERYEGEWRLLAHKGFVHVDLQQPSERLREHEQPRVRNLYLFLPAQSAKYIEGFMTTGTNNPVLFNNSILLKRSNRSSRPSGHEPMPIYGPRYKEIHAHVREYFKVIPMNWQRTASGRFGGDKKIDDEIKARNTISRPFEHDIYLSAPITSCPTKEHYAVVQEVMHELKKICSAPQPEGLGLNNVYCLVEGKDGKKLTYEQAKIRKGKDDFHQVEVDTFWKSKYFLLFLPFDVPTDARLLASWVFAEPRDRHKRSIFIIDSKIQLSTMVQYASDPLFTRVNLIPIDSCDQATCMDDEKRRAYVSKTIDTIKKNLSLIRTTFSDV